MIDSDSGSVDVAGGSLHWQAAGRGTPFILLHGFSLDQRSWDLQLPSWTAQHRVVRYDLRGFGSSTVRAGHVMNLEQPAEFAAQVSRFIDAL